MILHGRGKCDTVYGIIVLWIMLPRILWPITNKWDKDIKDVFTELQYNCELNKSRPLLGHNLSAERNATSYSGPDESRKR